jgi:hypothetical protein
MRHPSWTQVNQGDSQLLTIENQIGTLISDLSFGHNLCFKYSNESCKPILDIYVSRYFEWYKDLFNPMSFDLWNCSMKGWNSIKTPTPKVRAHLRVCGFIPSHSPTLPGASNVIFELHFQPSPLQALALVTSLRLKSWLNICTYNFLKWTCCLYHKGTITYYKRSWTCYCSLYFFFAHKICGSTCCNC